jgi:hypothetical protein
MNDDTTQMASEEQRGHNLPPDISLLPSMPPTPSSDQIEKAILALEKPEKPLPYDAAKLAAFRVRVSLFAEACAKWAKLGEITSKEQAERLTDFFGGSRSLWKQIDDLRKEEKRPHAEAGNTIQEVFTTLLEVVKTTMDKLAPMQAAWLAREQKRIDDEKAEAARVAQAALDEANRKAAIAAANNDVIGEVEAKAELKAAKKDVKAAARPERARAGSATGAGHTMAARLYKHAVIVNQSAVYMHFRDEPRVIELLQSLATAAVRSGITFPETVLTVKEIEGVA